MNQLILQLHCLRPSLNPSLTTPSPASNFLLFSTSATATQAPSPDPHFTAVDYLINSCGLSSDEALRSSKYISYLKSPDRPDSVLRFLRETGIAESAIQSAVRRNSRVLCSGLDSIWRPNIQKLKEVGFSLDDISVMVARYPMVFNSNVVPKIEFWMQALESTENTLVVLRRYPPLLCSSLKKVLVPNLSFLRDQLGLNVSQIVLLLRVAPFLIKCAPQTLLDKVKKAEELGVPRSSRMFVYALSVVSNFNSCTIDARLKNLRSLGLSQEEVTTLVNKNPLILRRSEEDISRKIKYLFGELGYDSLSVVQRPVLFTLSLEKRLIPRNLVWKLMKLKGLPAAKLKFYTYVKQSEKQFEKKFVLPYENAIPGLHQAYVDACAGKIRGIEWFKNTLN